VLSSNLQTRLRCVERVWSPTYNVGNETIWLLKSLAEGFAIRNLIVHRIRRLVELIQSPDDTLVLSRPLAREEIQLLEKRASTDDLEERIAKSLAITVSGIMRLVRTAWIQLPV